VSHVRELKSVTQSRDKATNAQLLNLTCTNTFYL